MGRLHGDILDRALSFSVAVVELTACFPENNRGWVLGKQLLRSATSIGANLHEADAARTRREFISFCNIAQREAAESSYWLLLCQRVRMVEPSAFDPLLAEADELRRIICTICRNSASAIS